MPDPSMRRSIPVDGTVDIDRLRDLEQAALRHGVPVEDVLLIAVNLYGITSDHARNRSRVNLRLIRRPDVAWQIIVPLNQPASPLRKDPALTPIEQQLLGLPDRRQDGSLAKGSGAAPIRSWWEAAPGPRSSVSAQKR
ncbi:hypothetical protein ABZ736_30955 [Streptomyces sp. NPDC013099]|uniref:hypothetical protein n=1 Tax=Streptomyces sp. NPDC013099 TaxID=3156687 RepID=UPI0033EF8DD4